MDEFVLMAVRSRPGESPTDFAGRLSAFWTHLLRNRPDDYAKVYAEATAYESDGTTLGRRYAVEPDGVDVLEREVAAAGLELAPIDSDDLYTKYEIVGRDWMQIEH